MSQALSLIVFTNMPHSITSSVPQLNILFPRDSFEYYNIFCPGLSNGPFPWAFPITVLYTATVLHHPKPCGTVTTVTLSALCSHSVLCFLRSSKQTGISCIKITNWLFFIMHPDSIFCAEYLFSCYLCRDNWRALVRTVMNAYFVLIKPRNG